MHALSPQNKIYHAGSRPYNMLLTALHVFPLLSPDTCFSTLGTGLPLVNSDVSSRPCHRLHVFPRMRPVKYFVIGYIYPAHVTGHLVLRLVTRLHVCPRLGTCTSFPALVSSYMQAFKLLLNRLRPVYVARFLLFIANCMFSCIR